MRKRALFSLNFRVYLVGEFAKTGDLEVFAEFGFYFPRVVVDEDFFFFSWVEGLFFGTNAKGGEGGGLLDDEFLGGLGVVSPESTWLPKKELKDGNLAWKRLKKGWKSWKKCKKIYENYEKNTEIMKFLAWKIVKKT